MRAIAAGVTDVGKERAHNEDCFVLLPEFEAFVVADGMGGHQCGEVASRMAASTIASFFRTSRQSSDDSSLSDTLRASLEEANERIHRRAMMSMVHRGMGTTVVAAAFNRRDGKFHVAHAGDSRCYLLRLGEFEQLTRDHSLVEEALRSRPDITKSELAYLPANVITRALGVEANIDVDLTVSEARSGDLFLLCSDGLHGFVNDDRIMEIMSSTEVLTNACAELIAEANRNGGGDNITAVLVRIEERDEPWAKSTSVPPPPGKSAPGPQTPAMRAARLPRIENSAGATVATSEAAGKIKSSTDAAEARAKLEAEDTGRLAAVIDPDAVLDSSSGSSIGDADTVVGPDDADSGDSGDSGASGASGDSGDDGDD